MILSHGMFSRVISLNFEVVHVFKSGLQTFSQTWNHVVIVKIIFFIRHSAEMNDPKRLVFGMPIGLVVELWQSYKLEYNGV